MATNHRNEPVNDNNKAKTNAERMGLSDEQIENPDGTFRNLSYKDLAEGVVEGSMTYPDGTTVYPESYEYGEDGLEYNEDGLPEWEPPMVARDENGDVLDHSALLPSQHRTGRGSLA